jgi:hypothetical protein
MESVPSLHFVRDIQRGCLYGIAVPVLEVDELCGVPGGGNNLVTSSKRRFGERAAQTA